MLPAILHPYYSHLIDLLGISGFNVLCSYVTVKHFAFLHQEFHQRFGFCSGLPPCAPSTLDGVGNGAFGNNRNARAMNPQRDDGRWPKRKANRSLISIVVLSAVVALIICTASAYGVVTQIQGFK